MVVKAPKVGSFCAWVQSVVPTFSTCSGKIEREGDYYCPYHHFTFEMMVDDDKTE